MSIHTAADGVVRVVHRRAPDRMMARAGQRAQRHRRVRRPRRGDPVSLHVRPVSRAQTPMAEAGTSVPWQGPMVTVV